MVICPCCRGTGWLIKKKPHPLIPEVAVTFTRACINCGTTGRIPDTAIDRKQMSAGDTE